MQFHRSDKDSIPRLADTVDSKRDRLHCKFTTWLAHTVGSTQDVQHKSDERFNIVPIVSALGQHFGSTRVSERLNTGSAFRFLIGQACRFNMVKITIY